MGIAYTKEFLVSVVMWKYREASPYKQNPGQKQQWLNNYYDQVGKETFRKHCGITPELIRKFNSASKTGLEFLEVSCYNGNYE